MTLVEIIELCRFSVREPTPAFFTDDEIMIYTNLKSLEFCRRTTYLRDMATLTDSGGGVFPLPNDFLTARSVILDTKGVRKEIFKQGASSRVSKSYLGVGYVMNSEAITLSNVGDLEDDSTMTIELDYAKRPYPFLDLEADKLKESDIPEEFIEVLTQGITAKMFEKQERYPSARESARNWDMGVKEAKKFANTRQGQGSINIVK